MYNTLHLLNAFRYYKIYFLISTTIYNTFTNHNTCLKLRTEPSKILLENQNIVSYLKLYYITYYIVYYINT
ncbi:hypothetical protein EB796_024179 [Bugula neritina]|uniref:Uncharacterized protein n=1 Tax=Bugula neritina TaxID=10212 RepID=A0A7J7IU99_BUGNE|nr:hypothetical protein EB796_024179 [Bugula neritina]